MKNLATITFLIIVFTFSINQCTKVVDKIDKSENRTLAKKPNLDINRLDFFPLEYDRYLKDNFAGRKYFIDGYNWLNNIILHKRSPNGKHLYGKDNYIFEMKKNLPLYTGKRTVSEEQLNRILTEFKERQKYFDSIGVKMYIQIIPSKYTVYSNKIPFFLTKVKTIWVIVLSRNLKTKPQFPL